MIAVTLVVGLVVVNTIGGSYVQSQPLLAQGSQQPDNTGLWIGLISTLVVAALTAATTMFNTWMNVKLRIAMKENTDATQQTKEVLEVNTELALETKKAIEVNTEITEQTKKAVNGQHKAIVELEKDKSHSEGFKEGVASQSGS